MFQDQTAQNTSSETSPNSIADVSILETLNETLALIWKGFIESLPLLAVAVIILVLAWIVAKIVDKILSTALEKAGFRTNLRQVISRLVNILIWLIGFMAAAMVVFPGMTPAKLLGAIGLAGVAIGFAFKDIFENFFAGILLLWKFPFEDGDFIECEDITGKVEEITIRMSKIRQTNGVLVVLPNAFLFKNPVYVLTERSIRRQTLMTGIGYDESIEEALPIIEKALQSCDLIDQDKPIQLFPMEFGASSIDIETRFWSEATPLGQRKARAQAVTAIKKALDDAGIEIPYAYRTITFRDNSPVPLDKDALSGGGDDAQGSAGADQG